MSINGGISNLRFRPFLSFGNFLASSSDIGASMTSTSLSACLRLRSNVSLIELDSLPVIFSGVEIHLRLDLKHKISCIPAEGLRTIAVFLDINVSIGESIPSLRYETL